MKSFSLSLQGDFSRGVVKEVVMGNSTKPINGEMVPGAGIML